MYETILLPVDGSEASAAATPHAVDLAKRHDAALHVLYVVDVQVFGPGDGSPVILDALEREGEAAIEEATEAAEDAGVETVEGLVGRGDPHRAILDYVDDEDVDLVVMGTHGRTGLNRYLLGSVTEKVVRLCDVPVLTVHPSTSDVAE